MLWRCRRQRSAGTAWPPDCEPQLRIALGEQFASIIDWWGGTRRRPAPASKPSQLRGRQARQCSAIVASALPESKPAMARPAAALLLAACLAAVALRSCAAFKAEEFKVGLRRLVCNARGGLAALAGDRRLPLAPPPPPCPQKCADSAFCTRLRGNTSEAFVIVSESVKVEGPRLTADVRNTANANGTFALALTAYGDTLRLFVDEQPDKGRFQVPDVLVPGLEARQQVRRQGLVRLGGMGREQAGGAITALVCNCPACRRTGSWSRSRTPRRACGCRPPAPPRAPKWSCALRPRPWRSANQTAAASCFALYSHDSADAHCRCHGGIRCCRQSCRGSCCVRTCLVGCCLALLRRQRPHARG